MNPESILSPLILILVVILAVTGLLKYAISIWAIRTSKTPAERKAQTEVARAAVSFSPLRDLVRWPGLKEREKD